MAKVMNKDMVAHVWAQQTQPEGYTSSRNLSFDGKYLRSYRLLIGHIVNSASEAPSVALILSDSSTHTTNGHMALARSAVNHYDHVFVVPYLGGGFERFHPENQEFLKRTYNDSLSEFLRQRSPRAWEYWGRQALHRKAQAAWDYAEVFGLEKPTFDIVGDAAKVDAHFKDLAEKANDPKVAERRQKARKRREAKLQEQARLDALALEERIQEWSQGAPVRLPSGGFRTAKGGVYLRVRGDKLETSMGVIVALEDAKQAFHDVMRLMARRIVAPVEINKQIGLFRINTVYPNGDIRAGCHLIEWAESSRIAASLGIETEPLKLIVNGN